MKRGYPAAYLRPTDRLLVREFPTNWRPRGVAIAMIVSSLWPLYQATLGLSKKKIGGANHM
jgi:hypothetical protein